MADEISQRSIYDGKEMIRAYKTADESVVNSTALQDDNHLSIALVSGNTYAFKLRLFVNAAGATSGIKVALSGTVGVAALKAQVKIYDDVLNALAAFDRISSLGAAVGIALSVGNSYIEIDGTIETNAHGTFLLQWAQNTIDVANAVTVQRGSEFFATKVS